MGKVDQTLFLLRQGRDILIVQVYVDDIVFGGSSNSLVARFAEDMSREFEMSMMGELQFFLVSYGPPWAHCLGGYQDRLLGGPLGLPDLRCMAPDGMKHKDYRGEVLG
jgi:hypothetical protein